MHTWHKITHKRVIALRPVHPRGEIGQLVIQHRKGVQVLIPCRDLFILVVGEHEEDEGEEEERREGGALPPWWYWVVRWSCSPPFSIASLGGIPTLFSVHERYKLGCVASQRCAAGWWMKGNPSAAGRGDHKTRDGIVHVF